MGLLHSDYVKHTVIKLQNKVLNYYVAQYSKIFNIPYLNITIKIIYDLKTKLCFQISCLTLNIKVYTLQNFLTKLVNIKVS